MIKFNPTKENYIKHNGKKVLLAGKMVMVGIHRTESRGGSWERGFRFYKSEWAMLTKQLVGTKYYKPTRVSLDHGKSWHPTTREAMKSKGKLRLSADNHGEFAFEEIQKINRQWEGPSFKWTR